MHHSCLLIDVMKVKLDFPVISIFFAAGRVHVHCVTPPIQVKVTFLQNDNCLLFHRMSAEVVVFDLEQRGIITKHGLAFQSCHRVT